MGKESFITRDWFWLYGKDSFAKGGGGTGTGARSIGSQRPSIRGNRELLFRAFFKSIR